MKIQEERLAELLEEKRHIQNLLDAAEGDNLVETLRDTLRRLDTLRDRYYELLYGVAKKFDNETRHETALRYIKEAETVMAEPCKTAIQRRLEHGRF